MFGVYLGWMIFGAFGGLLGAWYIHHIKYMEKDKFLREEKLKRTAHGPLGRPERPNVLTV